MCIVPYDLVSWLDHVYTTCVSMSRAQISKQSPSLYRSSTGLNELSYDGCHIKVKEPSLPYQLLIDGGRIVGFLSFPRLLAQCEMETALLKIWTLIGVSTSYNDKYYVTSVFTCIVTDNSYLKAFTIKIFFTLWMFTIFCFSW